MAPRPAERRERLEARVTREQKELLQRAAGLTGRSLTDFIVASAQRAAEETIRTHQVISLSARDSATFVRSLMEPPDPNEALVEAFRRRSVRSVAS
jgi:uncharacterized protein (DUF1778 family)